MSPESTRKKRSFWKLLTILLSTLWMDEELSKACNASEETQPVVVLGESEGEGSTIITDFSLRDQNGVLRTGKDLLGKVAVIYFGYTYCPQICPMAVSAIGEALKLLGSQADQVQPIFITLDPDRDGSELIKTYVEAFHTRFWGLRGDQAATQEAQQHFKVYAQKLPVDSAGHYDLDHSALIYIIDRKGQLHTVRPYSVSPEDLVHALKEILS